MLSFVGFNYLLILLSKFNCILVRKGGLFHTNLKYVEIYFIMNMSSVFINVLYLLQPLGEGPTGFIIVDLFTVLSTSSILLCVCAQLCPSLRPHGQSPTRLLCTWDFPGKNTRVVAASYSKGSS